MAGEDHLQGGLRSQFHHVIDIAPTIYEAGGSRSGYRERGQADADAGVSLFLYVHSAERAETVAPIFRNRRPPRDLS